MEEGFIKTLDDFISKTSFTASGEKDIDLDIVFEMSGATGIKPSAIFGIMRVESAGDSSAMATNPHKISSEPSLYSEPFGIDHSEVTNAWKNAGIPMESQYNVHRSPGKELLDKMMEINKLATVSVTAFGSMQVMGTFILPLYSNNPDTLLSDFESDPDNFSLNALISWVNNSKNSNFISYANSDNWQEAISLYYGEPKSDYITMASSAARSFKSKVANYLKKNNSVPLTEKNFKDLVGTYVKRGINLNKVSQGSNNYRAGLGREHVAEFGGLNVDFFKKLKNDLGIQTIVTLNADEGGSSIPGLAKSAGLVPIYKPFGEDTSLSKNDFNEIVEKLDEGNTLVHCTHGADRTGAVIGRYYIEKGVMNMPQAIADTKKYGGHKYESMKKLLLNGFS